MNLPIKTHICLSHSVVLLTKLLLTFSKTSYQPIYLKKIRSKKGSKESNENVISSDSHKNAQNVVHILGYSMIKHVNSGNVSGYMNLKVKSHPGATTEDLIDYVKPIARKKPKMLVIYTGTNDLSNEMNTIKKVKKVVQSIREIDVNQEIQIAFSGIINREDSNFAEKIEERNTKLESCCKSKGFVFINNSIMNSSSLNRDRLHLNQQGTGLL